MKIRPLVLQTDLSRAVELINLVESEPIQPSDFENWESNAPPGRIVLRVVAEDDQHAVTGYAYAVHETWLPAGHFNIGIIVEPLSRCQGIGAALYAELEAFTQANNGTQLTVSVHEDSHADLRFAEQRGFRIERHLFESVLDLNTFDESPYSGLISALEATGIRFFSLADAGNTRTALRKLYDVNYATVLDIPGAEQDWVAFEAFETYTRQAEWFRPEGQLLAADGDEYIALSAVQLISEKKGAYNLMTGVLPAYRGRKIALALKLLAIGYAKANGAVYLRTHNDSMNGPMLAINRKLGYQPLPGKWILKKNIDD
jgi:GNAT superfamily N-acetyltransferase